MAINEWKVWKKVGWVKEEEKIVKVEDDLRAVADFLSVLESDARELITLLTRMKDLVREEKTISTDLKRDNLEHQVQLLDELLKRYEFFQNDADINGIRVKEIGKDLLKKLKDNGLVELWREKKKDFRWSFDW
ncbi:hypothetical protein HOC13_03300 [Candidatus Woesearchaeota archaeon]|jgi:hypothetical protein|nr:hypothetical protein [Candidatus Woesearchaeota archaeon]